MDDIDRGQIGQKREVAYEIIKHPPKPQTNLPPMPVKPRPPRKKKGRSNENSGFIVLVLTLLIVVIIGAKLIGIW